MGQTEYLKLTLTPDNDATTTFREYRNIINGEKESNAIKIDKAFEELNKTKIIEVDLGNIEGNYEVLNTKEDNLKEVGVYKITYEYAANDGIQSYYLMVYNNSLNPSEVHQIKVNDFNYDMSNIYKPCINFRNYSSNKWEKWVSFNPYGIGNTDELITDSRDLVNAINEIKSNTNVNTDNINLKQDKEDITLETENKTIVGAINEVKSNINNIPIFYYEYNKETEIPFNTFEDYGFYFIKKGITASGTIQQVILLITIPSGLLQDHKTTQAYQVKFEVMPEINSGANPMSYRMKINNQWQTNWIQAASIEDVGNSLKLINRIELTEDTDTLIIDKNSLGKSYYLKDMVLKIYAPTGLFNTTDITNSLNINLPMGNPTNHYMGNINGSYTDIVTGERKNTSGGGFILENGNNFDYIEIELRKVTSTDGVIKVHQIYRNIQSVKSVTKYFVGSFYCGGEYINIDEVQMWDEEFVKLIKAGTVIEVWGK